VKAVLWTAFTKGDGNCAALSGAAAVPNLFLALRFVLRIIFLYGLLYFGLSSAFILLLDSRLSPRFCRSSGFFRFMAA
jgi:hypothetical protein